MVVTPCSQVKTVPIFERGNFVLTISAQARSKNQLKTKRQEKEEMVVTSCLQVKAVPILEPGNFVLTISDKATAKSEVKTKRHKNRRKWL